MATSVHQLRVALSDLQQVKREFEDEKSREPTAQT